MDDGAKVLLWILAGTMFLLITLVGVVCARWLWRTARLLWSGRSALPSVSGSVEKIARAAGTVAGRIEEKTEAARNAFQEGRRKR